ncbi:MAG: hypothetical protein JXQ29_07135 [Planctomycetes bacterium]|nr:hypothetical protein [Planctomycetota bacterium]
MRFPCRPGLTLAVILALAATGARGLAAPGDRTHRVDETYNGRPFEYTMERTAEHETLDSAMERLR